jgi:hypothetical protein
LATSSLERDFDPGKFGGLLDAIATFLADHDTVDRAEIERI